MKKALFVGIVFFIFSTNYVFAQSSYVLSYPSAMPGSIFYKFNLIKDEILKFWYFGDFGQFDYTLRESDKYLVEAKTLFDYKQYLLGHKALLSSDRYFIKIKPALKSASKNGKNISAKQNLLKAAAGKHIEELKKIKNAVPESFEWAPEKDKPTNLELWKSIDRAINVREKFSL